MKLSIMMANVCVCLTAYHVPEVESQRSVQCLVRASKRIVKEERGGD